MKSLFGKIFRLPVYVHLLAVAVVFVVMVYVTLKIVDVYTNHNQAVLVPDVRGLQIEDAAPFLEQNMLHYIIIDSVYTKEKPPGAIVELMPEADSKVKKNRNIYITINAKTEKTAPIPDLADISYREAWGILKARGFMYLDLKQVAGEHLNLTVGVEYEGRMIAPGTRVPLDANLFLVINDGNILPSDSISADGEHPVIIGGDESWF